MGSRLELYEFVVTSGQLWSGYMRHSTPSEAHYSLVNSFAVNVNDQSRFIVVLGKSLEPLIERYSSELNIDTTVVDVERIELDGSDLLTEMKEVFQEQTETRFTTLTEARINLLRLPLEEVSTPNLWLALTSDVTALIEEKQTYVYSMIAITFLLWCLFSWWCY